MLVNVNVNFFTLKIHTTLILKLNNKRKVLLFITFAEGERVDGPTQIGLK